MLASLRPLTRRVALPVPSTSQCLSRSFSYSARASFVLPTDRRRSTCQHVKPLDRRRMSTPPPQVSQNNNLTIEDYHTKADEAMEGLLETLEGLLDTSPGGTEYEVDYHRRLTLKLGSHGTYVINKQPPNKQIWLSSPRSGPKRYDLNLITHRWTYSRDQTSIDDLLSAELSDVFGEKVDIRVG